MIPMNRKLYFTAFVHFIKGTFMTQGLWWMGILAKAVKTNKITQMKQTLAQRAICWNGTIRTLLIY